MPPAGAPSSSRRQRCAGVRADVLPAEALGADEDDRGVGGEDGGAAVGHVACASPRQDDGGESPYQRQHRHCERGESAGRKYHPDSLGVPGRWCAWLDAT